MMFFKFFVNDINTLFIALCNLLQCLSRVAENLQGPPWQNVKLRSPLTESEIENHQILFHTINFTTQTICFIKSNLKLLQ